MLKPWDGAVMNGKAVFTTLLVLMASLIVSIRAESAAQLEGLNYLKDVVVEKADGGDLAIRFDFQNSNIDFQLPVFYPKSAQVDLANSYIKPAKRYFPTDDSRVPQVFVSQFDAKTVRVRLILGEDVRIDGKNLHLEKRERSLAIRVSKNAATANAVDEEGKAARPVVPARQVKPAGQGGEAGDMLDELLRKAGDRGQGHAAESMSPEERAKAAAESLASARAALGAEPDPDRDEPDMTEEHLPSPLADKPIVAAAAKTADADKELKFLDSTSAEDSAAPDLVASGMKMFSMLAVVLGLMFLILYVLKKYVLRNGMFGANEKLVKVLGTGMLAPRKSIALVEVAGEVLALGISNDHITLLATIREEDRIAQIKNASASTRGGLSCSPGIAGGSGDAAGAGVGGAVGVFSKYVKRFSTEKPEPRHTAAEVTALIRKNLGKVRTA
jgi:flagellar protein FliO/FliZ